MKSAQNAPMTSPTTPMNVSSAMPGGCIGSGWIYKYNSRRYPRGRGQGVVREARARDIGAAYGPGHGAYQQVLPGARGTTTRNPLYRSTVTGTP